MNQDAYLERLHALQAAAWPAGTPREPHYPHGRQPLSEYLRAWARLQPQAPALDFYGTRLSYAELDAQSDRCAALLRELGVGVGDRVAVAFVVLKPGGAETADSLQAWCREAMAVYKVPQIRLLDSLPMTATGKVKKNELEKLL